MGKIFVVKTAIGREDQVIDFLASNAKKGEGVYSLLFPHGMLGYIFIEASELNAVRQIAYRVPYVRRILTNPIKIEEVEHLIEFKPEEVDINVGDTVTITAGPFKGEKGRVTRLNIQKSEVIIELLEAAVSIPITLNLDSVKVIGRKEEVKE